MNAVRWDEIEHAFGPATDVPELIRTVAEGAEPEALKACAELSEALNHQDSVYPACGPTVPLLIEALARRGAAGPGRLLGLLVGTGRFTATI